MKDRTRTLTRGNGLAVRRYHAVYYPIEDGWYLAEVLDFPGTLSQGRTLRSARRMIRGALRLMAEALIERGEPLPKPRPMKPVRRAAFAETIPLQIRARTGSLA
jgi:predicted RNase H-like HicB family nuclease